MTVNTLTSGQLVRLECVKLVACAGVPAREIQEVANPIAEWVLGYDPLAPCPYQDVGTISNSAIAEKLTQQQIAAVESARHELVTLGGLLAADGAAPSETFTINVDVVIKQLDEAFSPLFENDTTHS